jgi:hypothetical protein
MAVIERINNAEQLREVLVVKGEGDTLLTGRMVPPGVT